MDLKSLETNNIDIAGLVDRLRVLRYEIHKSQSANILHSMPFDMERMRKILSWCRSYKDYMVADPVQDRPESTPQLIKIKDFEDLAEPQNPEHRDLMRHLEFVVKELVDSQSSRLGNSLLPFDSNRYDNYETKILALFDHIEATNPIDAPEFTPSVDNTGPGRGGI